MSKSITPTEASVIAYILKYGILNDLLLRLSDDALYCLTSLINYRVIGVPDPEGSVWL